jgi:hypothetical protein
MTPWWKQVAPGYRRKAVRILNGHYRERRCISNKGDYSCPNIIFINQPASILANCDQRLALINQSAAPDTYKSRQER